MKTSQEKEQDKKIKGLKVKIKDDKSEILEKNKMLASNYEKVKDFTLSDNKTKIVLEKMKSLNQELKTVTRRLQRNESELEELL